MTKTSEDRGTNRKAALNEGESNEHKRHFELHDDGTIIKVHYRHDLDHYKTVGTQKLCGSKAVSHPNCSKIGLLGFGRADGSCQVRGEVDCIIFVEIPPGLPPGLFENATGKGLSAAQPESQDAQSRFHQASISSIVSSPFTYLEPVK